MEGVKAMKTLAAWKFLGCMEFVSAKITNILLGRSLGGKRNIFAQVALTSEQLRWNLERVSILTDRSGERRNI
jgi:hypothetical protein